MSARRIRAVARRVIAQFRRDHRSIALLLVAPVVVLSLVGAIWGQRTVAASGRTILDDLAPALIAFFAFFFSFLLAAVAFLRERTSGTLERLFATPLRRGELVAGYLAGFGIFALLQVLVIVAFTVGVLGVRYRGSPLAIVVIEAVLVIGAVSLGLAVSAFARNELQAVQFVPLVILPQVFLSGLLVPVDQLPDLLRPIAAVLPLTYATEGLRAVMLDGLGLADGTVLRDLAALVGFALAAALAAMATIRREAA